MTSQGDRQIKALVAANIDRGIVAKGLTNRAVGDKIGKTEHQVWRWRKGHHSPSLEALASLADVLFAGDLTEFYVNHKDGVAA